MSRGTYYNAPAFRAMSILKTALQGMQVELPISQ